MLAYCAQCNRDTEHIDEFIVDDITHYGHKFQVTTLGLVCPHCGRQRDTESDPLEIVYKAYEQIKKFL